MLAFTPQAAEHRRTFSSDHFPSRRGSEAELACVACYIPR